MRPNSTRFIWAISAATSFGILAYLIANADWRSGLEILQQASYRWVALGLCLLLIDGLITAYRFSILVRGEVSYRDCLLANAWFGIFLLALPARLGEVAGIGLIVRYMHQSSGVAIINLVYQRLFDLLVLAVILLVLLLVSVNLMDSMALIIFAAGAFVFLIIILRHSMTLLTWFAAFCHHYRSLAPMRYLRRIFVQARSFQRRGITRKNTYYLCMLTILKWGCILTGVASIVVAVVPSVTFVHAVWVGVAYSLAAIIPLQAIGGFGISEAVLVGSFKWLGHPVAIGVPLALAVRAALIAAPLIFWAGVVSMFSPSGNSRRS